MAIQEKLAAEFPAVPAYCVALGGSYCNFGRLVSAGGKPYDSLEWFAKAMGALRPIHEQEPHEVTARQFLRASHWNRAIAYDRLRRYTEAVRDWDKAIELSPKEEQPGLRAARTTSRLQIGEVAKAVAEADELTKSRNWNADQWYDFACVYSVASSKIAVRKDEYADRAMELLQQAVKAGYKNAAHMQKDTDLTRCGIATTLGNCLPTWKPDKSKIGSNSKEVNSSVHDGHIWRIEGGWSTSEST
jgi:tetratricopeptide (TPR) repeat protein